MLVYGFTISKFIRTSVFASVYYFRSFVKSYLLCKLQCRISRLNIKDNVTEWIVKTAYFDYYHIIFGIPFSFLISQNSFDSAAPFLCFIWLNDIL